MFSFNQWWNKSTLHASWSDNLGKTQQQFSGFPARSPRSESSDEEKKINKPKTSWGSWGHKESDTIEVMNWTELKVQLIEAIHIMGLLFYISPFFSVPCPEKTLPPPYHWDLNFVFSK